MTPPLVVAFRRLHAAEREITRDLDLSVMLPLIASTAREIIGVDSAVLAARDPDGTVEVVVADGLDDDTARRISGLGTAERIHAAAEDLARRSGSQSVTVPIPVSGEHWGDLHLSAHRPDGFSADDVEILDALAGSAGSAIEHAMLSRSARSSTEWLHASGEIARALLADADIDTFNEVVARAVSAAGADYGHLIIPTTDGRLRVLAADGLAIDDHLGRVYDADHSDMARAVVNGKALRSLDIEEMLTEGFDNKHDFGPVMLVPLLDALGTRGSVLVTRSRGRQPFTDTELDQFAMYAAQVALAMQFADARTDAERLQVVSARADTSRHLSDIVLQRLFATGLGLHQLAGQLTDADQATVLERHITDFDRTIDEIREHTFDGADDAAPNTVKFPRVPLPAERTGSPRTTAPSAQHKRGRRRADWRDGSGIQKS